MSRSIPAALLLVAFLVPLPLLGGLFRLFMPWRDRLPTLVAGMFAPPNLGAEYGRAFPMMMTAAGTVPAARVFVMGAGVAGLQAIATARRLGAVVSAFDVRPVVKEQVESLGATFLELEDADITAHMHIGAVVLLEDGWTVVDTGIGNEQTRGLWERILANRKVKRVLVTHYPVCLADGRLEAPGHGLIDLRSSSLIRVGPLLRDQASVPA